MNIISKIYVHYYYIIIYVHYYKFYINKFFVIDIV